MSTSCELTQGNQTTSHQPPFNAMLAAIPTAPLTTLATVAERYILLSNLFPIRYLLIRKASPRMMKAMKSQPIGRKA